MVARAATRSAFACATLAAKVLSSMMASSSPAFTSELKSTLRSLIWPESCELTLTVTKRPNRSGGRNELADGPLRNLGHLVEEGAAGTRPQAGIPRFANTSPTARGPRQVISMLPRHGLDLVPDKARIA